MAPEPRAVDVLAQNLQALAAGENVRAIEALAATLVNRRAADGGQAPSVTCMNGLAEAPAPWLGANQAAASVCRRVARRALGGSLTDPTGGATAFHHIDATPDWARGRYPVAVFGSYLFYRL